MPALPQQLAQRYQLEYGLSEYDAEQLCLEKEISEYFEATSQHTCLPAGKAKNYKAVANWVNGPLKQLLNEEKILLDDLKPTPAKLAEIIILTEEGKISFSSACSKLLPEVLKNDSIPVAEMAKDLNLFQTSDTNELENWIQTVLNKMPAKVAEYKKGKKGLMGLFVGEVKKISKGKADLHAVTAMLEKELN
jgi:aspartyl-tRNA(Asn)/glutamyl-tRNA(Gln) amidotransferase subunit B